MTVRCHKAEPKKARPMRPTAMSPTTPIFCALDTTDEARAADLARGLKGSVGGVKIGMEFFNAHGPKGYARVAEAGIPIFLDLKLHDIPNTVAGGIRAVLPLKQIGRAHV